MNNIAPDKLIEEVKDILIQQLEVNREQITPEAKIMGDLMADSLDVSQVEKLLAASGLKTEFKQYVRGNNAVQEIEAMVESLQVSMLIIGLRKRSPVGKLFLGSVAQEVLLSVPCPVLGVKA